jgi:glycosyltransferase involved in cell wall biosynthesis
MLTGRADGVFTHLKELFLNIDQEKYEQFLIFFGEPNVERELQKIGMKFYILPELRKKFSLKAFTNYYKIIKKEKTDIIQVHLLKPYAIAGIANIILRKKLIYNYHGLFIESEYYSGIEKLVFKIAHYFICITKGVHKTVVPSEGSKVILETETKLFKDIVVYHNSTEILDYNSAEHHNAFNKNKGKFLIGLIARIEIQKRIDRALQIIKLVTVNNRDVHFVIIGDGPLENKMKELTYELNLQEQVEFLNFIPNIRKSFNVFDAILLTSDWEGFPLVIWEAMSAGIPIVASDVGGIKGIIEKEKCGLVFQKDDVEGACQRILHILQNPQTRQIMCDNGINAIKTKYTVNDFKQKFEQLYTSLMEI